MIAWSYNNMHVYHVHMHRCVSSAYVHICISAYVYHVPTYHIARLQYKVFKTKTGHCWIRSYLRRMTVIWEEWILGWMLRQIAPFEISPFLLAINFGGWAGPRCQITWYPIDCLQSATRGSKMWFWKEIMVLANSCVNLIPCCIVFNEYILQIL